MDKSFFLFDMCLVEFAYPNCHCKKVGIKILLRNCLAMHSVNSAKANK